jgi:hypothetical protein
LSAITLHAVCWASRPGRVTLFVSWLINATAASPNGLCVLQCPRSPCWRQQNANATALCVNAAISRLGGFHIALVVLAGGCNGNATSIFVGSTGGVGFASILRP